MTKKTSFTIGSISIIGFLMLGCWASKQSSPESLPLVDPYIKKLFLSNHTVVPILGGIDHPDISPDSKRLLFTGQDRKIWTSDIDGRNPQRVSNLKWDANPTWSPDGKKIAFQSYGWFNNDFKIWVADADGKNLRQLEANPNPGIYGQQYPRWTPDGLYLVWSEGDHGLRISDINGKNSRNLTKTKGFQMVVDWSADGQSIYYADNPSCEIKSRCRRIDINGKNDRELNTEEIAQLEKKLSDQNFIYQCQNETKIYRSPLNNRANRKEIFDASVLTDVLVKDCMLSPDRTKLIFSIISKGGFMDTIFAINLRTIK